jgi:hypothetical protein
VHLDSTRHLTGHFNAHLHNAILVFADEAAWPGDKQGAGALKRMVTENTILIERKGMDALQVPNLMHLLLASNETWVWPAAVDERRGVIIDVDPRRRNDRNYFGMIERELFREGGLAAMLKDLLELKIQLDLREIPKTKALFEQKQLSASPQQRWWYEELREGTMWREPDRDAEGYWLDRDLVYDRYIKVIEKVRSRSDQGLKTELGMFLHKVLPTSYPREKRKLNGGRYWVLPPLSACRRAYEKLFNVAANEAQWLGEQAELSEGEDSREL